MDHSTFLQIFTAFGENSSGVPTTDDETGTRVVQTPLGTFQLTYHLSGGEEPQRKINIMAHNAAGEIPHDGAEINFSYDTSYSSPGDRRLEPLPYIMLNYVGRAKIADPVQKLWSRLGFDNLDKLLTREQATILIEKMEHMLGF